MSADLWEPSRAFALLERVLARSPAQETEATLGLFRQGVTRFAGSHIHQHVAEENAVLAVRAAVDGRVAGTRTNRLTPESLDGAAARAAEIAAQSAPDPAFPGLPRPEGPRPLVGEGPGGDSGDATPRRRAEAVRAFLDTCEGTVAAGALATWIGATAIANSHGIRAFGVRTRADFAAEIREGDGTAYLSRIAPGLDGLDMAALGRRALARLRAAQAPVDLPPGTYPAILEPDAVGLMLAYLAIGTFNGRAVLEGRSALSTRLGQAIMAPQVQIWDDPGDPRVPGLPFDAEGIARGRLDLVRDGVAVGVAHDSRTAREAGVANTARALAQPNPFGPMPLNLVMAPGAGSLDDLIEQTDRAVLVSRFHYVRVVHPARTVITGMTRAGTFLVEGGRIVRAVRNLRFNHAMLDAFAAADAISGEGWAQGGDVGVTRFAPAMRVREFTFTSGTLF